MTRRRAFTLIEMMLVVALTALVVGAVTAVYAYTVERLGYGVADARTQHQAEYGVDIIDATISKAQACSIVTVGANTCIKCTMPADCSDVDGDGILDTCSPARIDRRSLERWGNGERVWFYLADSTGAIQNPGTMLWMASRADDTTPGTSDIVQTFTYYPGNSKARLDLLQRMTPEAAPTSNQFSVGLWFGEYASQGGGAAPSTASTTSSYQFDLVRWPYLHGWRL